MFLGYTVNGRCILQAQAVEHMHMSHMCTDIRPKSVDIAKEKSRDDDECL
jgi:hypothetical protein